MRWRDTARRLAMSLSCIPSFCSAWATVLLNAPDAPPRLATILATSDKRLAEEPEERIRRQDHPRLLRCFIELSSSPTTFSSSALAEATSDNVVNASSAGSSCSASSVSGIRVLLCSSSYPGTDDFRNQTQETAHSCSW